MHLLDRVWKGCPQLFPGSQLVVYLLDWVKISGSRVTSQKNKRELLQKSCFCKGQPFCQWCSPETPVLSRRTSILSGFRYESTGCGKG